MVEGGWHPGHRIGRHHGTDRCRNGSADRLLSVAALTIYDMTKALDKRIEIQDIYLLEKTGGKSGDFSR